MKEVILWGRAGDKEVTETRAEMGRKSENPEPEEFYGAELHLDPSVVKERRESYSSLSDLYGIEIFSDRIHELQEEKKREEAARRSELMEDLSFLPGKKLDEKERKLRERLFLSEGMAYRKEEMKQQSDSGTDAIILPGMLLLFFFLCTGISVFWGRKDRRR